MRDPCLAGIGTYGIGLYAVPIGIYHIGPYPNSIGPCAIGSYTLLEGAYVPGLDPTPFPEGMGPLYRRVASPGCREDRPFKSLAEGCIP